MQFRVTLTLAWITTYLLCSCTQSPKQNDQPQLKQQAIYLGEQHTLFSNVLNQDRELLIYAHSSSSPTNKYIVLYLLDGDDLYFTAIAALKTLSKLWPVPPILVVGVKSPAQSRLFELSPSGNGIVPDYLQTNFGPQLPLGSYGGAPAFLKFLDTEVVKYVDQHYPNSEQKIWVGHSLSGLALIDKIINHPTSDSAYILISPVLWWQNPAGQTPNDWFQQAIVDSPTNLPLLYIGMGDNEGADLNNTAMTTNYLSDANSLKNMFESLEDDIYWTVDILAGESHMLSPATGLIKGLQFILDKKE